MKTYVAWTDVPMLAVDYRIGPTQDVVSCSLTLPNITGTVIESDGGAHLIA